MNSIRKKLTVGILLIVTIISFIGYALSIVFFLDDKKEDSEILAKSIATVVAQDISKIIYLNSVYTAVDITTKLKSFPTLKSVTAYDLKDRAVYHFSNHIEDKNTFRTKLPLIYKKNRIGYIDVELYYETIPEIIKEYWLPFTIFYIVIIVISFLMAWYYAKIFTKPIFDLVEFLDKIDLSLIDRRITNIYNDEFGKLYHQVNEMLGNLQLSIIKLERSEGRSLFLQTHDRITFLLNKESFLKEYQKNLDENYNKENLIIAIDIEHFHIINELYSYKTGDKVLLKVSKYFRVLFKNALLAKMGNDIFILGYSNLDRDDIEAKIKDVIDGVKAFNEVKIDNHLIHLSFNIGINKFKHKDALRALKEVDIALINSKKQKTNIVFFNKKLERVLIEKDLMKRELKSAIKNDEIIPYYQLQFREDKSIYGAEALVRWRHPTKGILPPSIFIKLAEEDNLVVEIGNIMLKKVCKQLAIWSKNNKTRNWHISINVHNLQFNESLITILKNNILEYKIKPSLLTIEILENVFLENSSKNIKLINEIKSMGIEISVDDFGTGFSSLQYIKSMPIDEIKIDKSFILEMFKNRTDIPIIKSLIFLGDELNIKVLAEGVETKEHYENLKRLNCKYYQGYYFESPQAIEYIQKKYID